ncbi:MAG: ATP-binding protein [Halioglobus sp.]
MPVKPTGANTTTFNPSSDNLRSLLLMRAFALLGQTLILLYVWFTQGGFDGQWSVVASLVTLATLTAISLWRSAKPWPVADNEFLVQLLLDIGGWSILMYLTGGANNPFISYLIVPIVISAAVLPRAYTWGLGILAGALYGLLLNYYQAFPLFTPHQSMGHGMDHGSSTQHIVGMWFNFLFSVVLISFFVVRMAQTMNRQEQWLAQQREDRLRDDQIMAVASLAAGTAHELGTPLSTMAVLIDEMLSDEALSPQAREDCELLAKQVQQCKHTMTELTRTAELDSAEQRSIQAVGEFTHGVMERWRVRRPGIDYEFNCADQSPKMELDTTLAQAIENLLNNAADSGSEKVAMQVEWDSKEVIIEVRDWGSGISPEKMASLGKPVIHADRSGLGIGLMLSQAAVARYQGSIALRNHKNGGALATMRLPIVLEARTGENV